ncbi:type IV conjugative transfer system lipoprotein TraV [Klebsiella aerogenes]|uniref:type IV conjugative transfer system lipoprotein TraV n=1 Tax=Klebsiella aerogenes TaxID=548 RepID=UPI000DA1D13C|nr:type IV conjugative transfer system lipoprotein TraV [Klebsiella aerogenes]HCB2859846.1 type IV conjugative transfer system lipoprotein TraV [Klebsiella aerogenes]HCB2864849.1 type IV conjugative transfer system lipoprotein TraV [Klebsiella aerogenes]HCB2880479.1 type IV conjugative transfer system lipoprotein TraV [Klebsiella aerogenes]HCB3345912.1 type IV conjugative transfer system lipoprotein TraV [Klebsiella aerogenes]HCM1811914.1 type IV conjugative transfer system lipoprotein TraV [K
MRSALIPVILAPVLLSGCAGMNTEFDCNVKAEDRCMTMEEANAMASRAEGGKASPVSPVSTELPRLAPVPVVPSPVTGIQAANRDAGPRMASPVPSAPRHNSSSGITPAAHPVTVPATRPAPSPVISPPTTPRPVLPSPASAAQVYADIGVTPPVRVNPTTARLWIAGWIDADDVYHQPAVVSFVVQGDHWYGS